MLAGSARGGGPAGLAMGTGARGQSGCEPAPAPRGAGAERRSPAIGGGACFALCVVKGFR